MMPCSNGTITFTYIVPEKEGTANYHKNLFQSLYCALYINGLFVIHL
jgi:hypothetical protein